MSKLLVVVGATGYQGRSVISYFQRTEPTWKIRGLTRNPSSENAVALANSGVEIQKADLIDLQSLKTAFAGANYIFAYTDFAGIVGGPDVMGKFMAGQIKAPIGAECFKIEFQHGKNVADAAATVPQLERLVWSSLPGVAKISKGKYTQCFHFDSKAAVTEYMVGLKALEGKVSDVQMGSFANNITKGLDFFGFNILADKTALWKPPFPKSMPLPWVDVEKDTGAFVKALIDAPAPTHVMGVSEWMSCEDWLDHWSAITGVPSRLEEVEQKESDITDDPTGLKLEFLQTAQFLTEFGFGDPTVVSPEDLENKGISIPRTKVAEYISREDWSVLLG